MTAPRKRKVDRYDGQTVFVNGKAHYDLGNYLGGGAAGVVYEATNLKCGAGPQPKQCAMKILNPVGFKLMPSGPLQRCLVARKGMPLPPPRGPGGSGGPGRMGPEHVWCLVHPTSKALIAAMVDPRSGQLRELPLPRCIEVWGWDPLRSGGALAFMDDDDDDEEEEGACSDHTHHTAADRRKHRARPGDSTAHDGGGDVAGRGRRFSSSSSSGGSVPLSVQAPVLSDEAAEKLAKEGGESVHCEALGASVLVPRVPPKFLRWLRARQGIFREIANMAHLGAHPNVVGLVEVLEYVQDSKATLFLVLELVTGGELFDRIAIGKGTSEATARRYFEQLVAGAGYCHGRGVCHRDLKPENLLLADSSDRATLKIADFGLSAAFAIAATGLDARPASASSSPPRDETSDPSSLPSPSPSCGRSRDGSPPAPPTPVNMRRLRSVVGSPHYVAPEVTRCGLDEHCDLHPHPNNNNKKKNPRGDHQQAGGGGGGGYDGPCADVWSAGVILYAMVAGTLPFGKELSRCPRFGHFHQWMSADEVTPRARDGAVHIAALPATVAGCPPPPLWARDGAAAAAAAKTAAAANTTAHPPGPRRRSSGGTPSGGVAEPKAALEGLAWFFPAHFPQPCRALVVAMLHPEPSRRPTMAQVARHAWVRGEEAANAEPQSPPSCTPPPPPPPWAHASALTATFDAAATPPLPAPSQGTPSTTVVGMQGGDALSSGYLSSSSVGDEAEGSWSCLGEEDSAGASAAEADGGDDAQLRQQLALALQLSYDQQRDQ